jgi:hypothetical protein
MTERTWKRLGSLALAAAISVATAGCGDVVRQGRSPAYLMVTKIIAASGAEPEEFSDELSSDVVTKGGVVEDLGTVTLRLALKDIGQPAAPAAPTANNYITITRYRVSYKRSDGRNTPGVDVPYAFDGAGTVTVTDKDAELAFVLVRVQAKLEPPLRSLRELGGSMAISTIADITFYGRDQAGNEVSATGSISVNFADWADPTEESEE